MISGPSQNFSEGKAPSEIIELIRAGYTTKDFNRDDIPALVVLFDEGLIVIEEIKTGYCTLKETK